MGVHNSSGSRSDRRVEESFSLWRNMKGFVAVFTGIVASGSVSGAPQNFIMNRCTNDCNIRDLSNIEHNQVSTNYVDYRNENTYNLDNIFTNVRSTSTSSNDYFNVLPYFFGNNRRYKREALREESAPYAYQTRVQNPDQGMEYQVDVTVDRNGNSRSLQRVQQNEVEIRDPSQSYQMLLERSMQHGLNGNRRENLVDQKMELLEDRLMLEQYRADIISAEERSMLEQRQMRERERMDNRRMMEQRFMDQRNMDDQTNMDQRNEMDQYRMDQRNNLDQDLLERRHMRNEQMMDSKNLKEQIYLEQREKVGQDQIDQKRAMLDRVEDQERRLMEQQQMMKNRGEQFLRMDQGQANRMEEQKRMEGLRMGAQKQMSDRRMYMRNPMVNRRTNQMA